MFGIGDDSVLISFEESELHTPSARKELNDRTIYTFRELGMPKEWGAPVLCDFGSAVPGDIEHSEDAQPNIYRAPEVILEVPWTYSVDIWNVGCMVRSSFWHFRAISKLLNIDLGPFRKRVIVHRPRSKASHLPESSSSR